MYHRLSFTSLTEGHVGCFQFLAETNKTAVNVCGQVFI